MDNKPQQKKFKLFLVNKRRVKILEVFTHSVLVQYFDDGTKASISKDAVKIIIKEYTKKDKPSNNQLNLF